MHAESRIFVAGHQGLVGSAIVRKLRGENFQQLILKTRKELDLRNQSAVDQFFQSHKIEYVFFAAAKVGGIYANMTQSADFLYENLIMTANVLHAAAQAKVKKVLFLGSSCIYPKNAPQPILESSLLTSPLEPTNEAYAIAKIAGLKLCEMYQKQYQLRFVSTMPTNLYGIYDRFHSENSHVIPGLLRRFHEAKCKNLSQVVIWGTGTPKREFLYVDDLADALFLLMHEYEEPIPINIGSGEEYTIRELASLMQEITDYPGEMIFDVSKPDGTPRKILDSTRIHHLGWSSQVSLKEGLKRTYAWMVENASTCLC